MKMLIPSIGDTVILLEDWTFILYHEYRNYALINLVRPDMDGKLSAFSNVRITIPKGTELRINRIYIRQGKSVYDSITFKIAQWFGEPKSGKKVVFGKKTFWAKLHDVRNMDVEHFPHTKTEDD